MLLHPRSAQFIFSKFLYLLLLKKRTPCAPMCKDVLLHARMPLGFLCICGFEYLHAHKQSWSWKTIPSSVQRLTNQDRCQPVCQTRACWLHEARHTAVHSHSTCWGWHGAPEREGSFLPSPSGSRWAGSWLSWARVLSLCMGLGVCKGTETTAVRWL